MRAEALKLCTGEVDRASSDVERVDGLELPVLAEELEWRERVETGGEG